LDNTLEVCCLAYYTDAVIKCFAVSPEIWLDMQSDYELRVHRRTKWPRIAPRIRTIAA
jgi:plasmid maintenance system antidote protein VapI